MSEVDKLTAHLTALNAEIEQIEKDISAHDLALDDAALEAETSGNRKKYDTLLAKKNELQDAFNRKVAARTGVQKKLSEAKVAAHDANRAERERTGKAITGKQFKVAADAQEAIKVLARCNADMFDLCRDAYDEFRTTLGTRLNGAGISIGEWTNMLATELARVSSPGPLPPSHVPPALPGSRNFIFGGAAAKTPTLTEAMKAANEELRRRLTAAPLPVEKPKAPATPGPQQTTAEPADEAGPRIDGRQIARPRVKMA